MKLAIDVIVAIQFMLILMECAGPYPRRIGLIVDKSIIIVLLCVLRGYL